VPRSPGRPPLDRNDPSTTVHLRLPGRRYDELYAAAQRERISVPQLIREVLARVQPRPFANDENDDE
jgi:predicted HicB family RNase H-like nuclease